MYSSFKIFHPKIQNFVKSAFFHIWHKSKSFLSAANEITGKMYCIHKVSTFSNFHDYCRFIDVKHLETKLVKKQNEAGVCICFMAWCHVPAPLTWYKTHFFAKVMFGFKMLQTCQKIIWKTFHKYVFKNMIFLLNIFEKHRFFLQTSRIHVRNLVKMSSNRVFILQNHAQAHPKCRRNTKELFAPSNLRRRRQRKNF